MRLKSLSGEGPTYTSNNDFFDLNVWTHFAAAFSTSSDKLTVYKNGVQVTEVGAGISVSSRSRR